MGLYVSRVADARSAQDPKCDSAHKNPPRTATLSQIWAPSSHFSSQNGCGGQSVIPGMIVRVGYERVEDHAAEQLMQVGRRAPTSTARLIRQQ